MGIILIGIVGLIAGLVARPLVPAKDTMGSIATILLGVVGSFVGGFLSQTILGRANEMVNGLAFEFSGIIGSVIGAIIVLDVYHLVGRRSALPTVGR